jgi:hypothetical protein
MREKSDWSRSELRILRSFQSPLDIQNFLDPIKYNLDGDICKSPRRVLSERTAHCTEGAYFAAAALRFLAYPPLIVDLAAVNDDDHLLAVFKEKGLWGAVAKSNTTALRYRDPVYRSIRELVMSYFPFYFNTLGDKSLKGYSMPVNLKRFDEKDWMFTSSDLHFISDYLTKTKHCDVVDKQIFVRLPKTDEQVMRAVFLDADEEGLFKPKG